MCVGAAARAPHPLAERAEVGVVLDLDGQPERLGDGLRGARPGPAGQDRRVAELTRRPVHRAGQAHADAHHLVARDLGLLERVGEDLPWPARSPPWRADRRRARGGARPAARARDRRSPAAGGACRSRSRRPRRPGGAARSAPAGGRPSPRSGGCTGSAGSTTRPGGMQLADDRGHRRRCERGTACKVRARHGAGLGQHPDDARASVAARRPFHRRERYTRKCRRYKRR